nr:Chromosome 5 4 [Polyrhizophydium stewartii]
MTTDSPDSPDPTPTGSPPHDPAKKQASPPLLLRWLGLPKEAEVGAVMPVLVVACATVAPPLWEHVRTTFTDHTVVFWGTFFVSNGFYWGYSALMALLDLAEFPRALWRFKIQPAKKPTLAQYRKASARALLLQVVVNLPLIVLLDRYLCQWSGRNILAEELPSPLELVKHLLVFAVIEEVGFYYGHRLLHSPRLYRLIHKKHHEFTAPIGVAAQFTTINSHCGFYFPGFPTPLAHDYHHQVFNANYGVLGILDGLHGTRGNFLRWQESWLSGVHVSETGKPRE